MIIINDIEFSEYPGSCGTCPCFFRIAPKAREGRCILWNEMHHSYIDPPRRCKKLFNKVFKYPDGTEFKLFDVSRKER